ncbi:MAG: PqqD family protein [Chloroflexota bacterium]
MQYKQKPHIVHEIIEGEIVLLHPDNGKMLVLNESGTALWSFLGEWLTLEEMMARFTAVYDTPLKQAQQDIHQFITTLNQKGLLDAQAP